MSARPGCSRSEGSNSRNSQLEISGRVAEQTALMFRRQTSCRCRPGVHPSRTVVWTKCSKQPRHGQHPLDAGKYSAGNNSDCPLKLLLQLSQLGSCLQTNLDSHHPSAHSHTLACPRPRDNAALLLNSPWLDRGLPADYRGFRSNGEVGMLETAPPPPSREFEPRSHIIGASRCCLSSILAQADHIQFLKASGYRLEPAVDS